jgi:arylsulfatase A-like enzyme
MQRHVPQLLAAGLLHLASCSCGSEPAPAGVTLDLLARKPDALFELPAAVVPQGDVQGTLTWGTSEGAGWSLADRRLPGNVPYLETNHATASLMLPATRPAERELMLALWCARAVGAEPSRVRVRLNGIELASEGVVVGREPAEVRVHAPAPAWRLGENLLELEVPRSEDGQAWDTLALARVSYGAEARVGFEPPGTIRLVDGSGARYLLALADAAMLSLSGTSTGPGKLAVRAGVLDPRSGELDMESAAAEEFTVRDGRLAGELPLTLRPGLVRAVELEWLAPGGGVLALAELAVRERKSAPRPPIFFVSIDTFAARHLAVYGYARPTTPELARLREDAILFERCVANAPWTLPSYLSVLSGLYPRAHHRSPQAQAGAAVAPQDLWQLAPNRWTLAEAVRARGYRTAGFVDTAWLAPSFGFEQGFDVYNGEGAQDFEDPHKGIENIVERLVPAWLAGADSDHPPFLFLHALDAHGPYLPNEPFRDVFAASLPAERTLVVGGSDNQTYRWMPWWMSRTLQPDEKVPEAERVPLEEVVARYDESLLKVDAYLGKLFAELKARGLYDQAVIVVTGDHGEFFGPGMYGHGLMREAVLHVPLLVKLPGNARAGQHVSGPVALVDVYPTLLELAGVPADPARGHGRSLLAAGLGAGEDERVLFTEGGHVEQYAVTRGCWRLVEERPGSESSDSSLLSHPRVPEEWLRANCPELLTRPLTKDLLSELLARPGFGARLVELRALVAGPYRSLFDLCRDPEEQHDLAAVEPEVLASLLRDLEAERARARTAQAEARPSAVRATLTPEALDELDRLGYGGGAPPEENDAAPPKKPKKAK